MRLAATVFLLLSLSAPSRSSSATRSAHDSYEALNKLRLDPAVREQINRHQFQAQTVTYAARFPRARFDIIELGLRDPSRLRALLEEILRGVRDKTWNPGDYVPSYRDTFPDSSQIDVLARGNWANNKWNLEIRRQLTTFYKPPTLADSSDASTWTPWPDDIQLVPGRRYMMRITVYNASSTRGSQSPLLPLYLKPR